MPEVRSDLRSGEMRSFAQPVLSGTFFSGTEAFVLGALRDHRRRLIDTGRFIPTKALARAGLKKEDLKSWMQSIRIMARVIDPLEKWQDLVRLVSYSKRQKLKGSALFAQDLYEILDHLALFSGDLGIDSGEATLLQWQDPALLATAPSGEQWRLEEYGKETLSHPYELLEFLTNEFGLNPKPRAVILTEGMEHQALGALYEEVGAPPAQLGIEFRSLGGEGNFSLSNWQFFTEYMHEKQILVYFVLDGEGRTAQEARRLLSAKRRFSSPGLKKIIPAKDRIEIWGTSFEEANFTDGQISKALAVQGIRVSYQKIGAVRRRQRGKALINDLASEVGANIDKARLTQDLASLLITEIRSGRKRSPTLLEEFVERSARLIMLNHQPVCPDSRSRNRATGLLG